MRAPAVSLVRKLTLAAVMGLLACSLVPLSSAFAEGEGEAGPAVDSPQEVSAEQVDEGSGVAPMLASGLVGSPSSFVSADVALDGEPVIGSFTVDGLTFAVTEGSDVELVGVSPGWQQVTNSREGDGSTFDVPETVTYEGIDYVVASIGAYAFYLSGVTAVELPASVNDVDERAFRSSDVAFVEVAEDNPTYSSFDGALYDADQLSLLLIPEGKQGAVLLPKTAEVAEASVFSHCPLVDSISVEKDGAAFASENGLLYTSDLTTLLRVPAGATEITIREGCTTIAAGALEACANLTTINAPASVTSISPNVFHAVPTISLLAASLTGASEPGTAGEPSSQDAAPQLNAMVALSAGDDDLPVVDLAALLVALKEGSDSNPWIRAGFPNIEVLNDEDSGSSGDNVAEAQSALSARSGSSYSFVLYDAEGSGATAFCWILLQPDGTFIDAGGNSFGNGIKGLWPIGRQEGRFFYTTPVTGSGRLFIASNINAAQKEWYDVAFVKNEYTEAYSYPGAAWSLNETPYIAAYLTRGQARKVTWNGNGGNVAPGSCPAAMIGANSSTAYTWCGDGRNTLAPSATRSGCRFVGWTTQQNGTGTVYESADRIPAVYADTTYYAQWRYDVARNANGGSVSPTSHEVAPGGTVVAPKPTRTGYAFAGWATSSQGTPVCQAGASITVNSNVTYYAQWLCVVSWNANGGSVTPTSSNVASGKTVIAPEPTRSSYVFTGWATSLQGSPAYQAGASITVSRPVTYYAQWRAAPSLQFVSEENPESTQPVCMEVCANSDGRPTSHGNTVAFQSFITANWPIARTQYGLTMLGGQRIFTTDVYAASKPWPSGYTVYDVPYYCVNNGSVKELRVGETLSPSQFASTDKVKIYLTRGKACRVSWIADSKTVDSGFVGKGLQYKAPAAPTKDGYVFTGWSGSNGVTLSANVDYSGPINAETVTFTAQWRKAATLRFYSAEDPSSTEVLCLEVCAANDGVPTAHGNTMAFQSEITSLWPVARNSNGLVLRGGSRVLTSDVYAASKPWPSGYSVYDIAYYQVNGGSPQVLQPGGMLDPAAFSSSETVDIYLTRGWAHELVWNANGGSVDLEKSWVGNSRSVLAPIPKRTGFVCTGWSTEPTGGTTVCSPGQQSGPITESMTLYARWSAAILADAPVDATVRVDLLGIEDQAMEPGKEGYIESRSGAPLKVESVAFTREAGAEQLFGSSFGQVSLQALAGDDASWATGTPAFSFALDAAGADAVEDDEARLAPFAMAGYEARIPISYRFDIPSDVLAAIDPARFEQVTTSVCSVVYTVALAQPTSDFQES